jgi:hypothetical protein
MTTIDNVSRRIVEQLRHILPADVRVDADVSGVVRIRSANSQAVVEVFLASVTADAAYEQDYEQALLRAGRSLLSTVQDFVVEELGQPWPPAGRGTPGEMALPDATILDNALCLWYGDQNTPAVSMIRIPLTA